MEHCKLFIFSFKKYRCSILRAIISTMLYRLSTNTSTIRSINIPFFWYSGSSDVRLVGGRSPFVGRLELLSEGEWVTVCDDHFTEKEAQVVCRGLGFSDTRFEHLINLHS